LAVKGSPSRLLDKVIDKVIKEVESEIGEALKEAKQIVEQNFNKAMEKLNTELLQIKKNLDDEYEAQKAKMEIEMRMAIANEKEKWLNEIKKEFIERVKETSHGKDYEKFLNRIISSTTKDIQRGERIILTVKENDIKIIEKILKNSKIENYEIKTDDRIIGGFIISFEARKLSVDYTLNLIAERIFDENKGLISELIFEGE
jgi:vacuolar-type H+-ATPase subunit E/Vma4